MTDDEHKAYQRYTRAYDVYEATSESFWTGWNAGFLFGMAIVYTGRYIPWGSDEKGPVWAIVTMFILALLYARRFYKDIKEKRDRKEHAYKCLPKKDDK